ncbi:MAG: hypothetical protein R3309_07525 [Reinekea sp.]|nr:hypothetical protein [Reinekea sp.]
MNKTFVSLGLVAVVTSGCASLTYEARCAAPVEKSPSAMQINAATKTIRENYVYTERVYYSADEWVMFADKTNRDKSAVEGEAEFIMGTGNFLSDSELTVTESSFNKGQWSISKTHPKCYSLLADGSQSKGFLATSSAYPFAMKDENEASWKVDYFDYYYPQRIANDGKLALKNKDAVNDLLIEADGDRFVVNGESARLIRTDTPFANMAIQVDSNEDTYLILGVLRQANGSKYYVLKNNTQLLVMNGPKR